MGAAPSKVVKVAREVLSCAKCSQPCNFSGAHQLCCLPCGHIFGYNCIRKWIERRYCCPKCTRSVHAGQIIVCPNLQLRAFNTDQLHAWQQQLDSFTQQLVSAGASCVQQVLQYLQGQANAKLAAVNKKFSLAQAAERLQRSLMTQVTSVQQHVAVAEEPARRQRSQMSSSVFVRLF